MNTLKVVLIVGLAVLAVGLVAASAYAILARPATTPYGTVGGVTSPYGGSTSGVFRGGMMGGYGISTGAGYGNSAYGYGGCRGR